MSRDWQCPGCGWAFKQKWQLKKHLGNLFGLYAAGKLTSAKCSRNQACVKQLLRQQGLNRGQGGSLFTSRVRARTSVSKRPHGNVAVLRGGGACRSLPSVVEDVAIVERHGMSAGSVAQGVSAMSTLSPIEKYLRHETTAQRACLRRFLLHCLYSMHAQERFRTRELFE